jgi:hypothetical protein
MNEREFIELVRQMRILQRKYFRARSPMALREAKQYEKEVDEYLKSQEKDTTQMKMFS